MLDAMFSLCDEMALEVEEVGGNFLVLSNFVLNSFVCSFFGEKGQIKHPRVSFLLFFSPPGLVHPALGTSFPLALPAKSCCSTAV